MVDLRPQRRIAARIMKIGENRVQIDPEFIWDVELALTREDIKKLIADKVIRAKQKKGISRARVKKQILQRRKGRRRGHGKRKGKKTARLPRKKRWIDKVRPLRRYLKGLRDEGIIDRRSYRQFYLRVKGNSYRNLRHLKLALNEAGVLKRK
ncbi:MAG: 50S ribosomal protein L19e [Candidatus Heimdallarchaeota archaeon]